MKTYNKDIEAVSQLTPEQCRVTQQSRQSDRFGTNTGTTKSRDSTSMWCRASHYSRPSISSTAAPVVGRDRSPACALLHLFRRRNVENLFVVAASVYPFNAGYNPIRF